MTDQEIFNKVAAHLLKQNAASMKSGRCAYRGNDGKSCAIGCLIPDEIYDPSMENNSAWVLLEKFPQVIEFLPSVNLAQELQQCHDEWHPIDWKEQLASIAKVHNLTFTE